MIYDQFTVLLLTMMAGEQHGSTNAQIARYLLEHADELETLSVKRLASVCHVGTGTISRFVRETGFADFSQLKEAFEAFSRSYGRLADTTTEGRAQGLAAHVSASLAQVADGMDRRALGRLVDDLCTYEKVSAFGLLKGQAAAIDLQVDLLMQGKWVETGISLAEQMERIAHAGRDELIIVFSYTGAYFDYRDVSQELRRIDRPKIWMVCGKRRPLPSFVADCLLFDSDLDQIGHPYQLEFVAGLIAQEYAARQV